MRSGPPSVAGSATSTQDPLEEAVGLAIQVVQAEHAAAAFRGRAMRLAATVAEVLARRYLRERVLRVFLHWRLVASPKGRRV